MFRKLIFIPVQRLDCPVLDDREAILSVWYQVFIKGSDRVGQLERWIQCSYETMEESPGVTRVYVMRSVMGYDNVDGDFSPLILHLGGGTALRTNTIDDVDNHDPQ